MAVDIHPGKAIDQRPPGDLDLLEISGAELPRRKGVRQRLPGQLIIPRLSRVGGPGRDRKRAAGNDLEWWGCACRAGRPNPGSDKRERIAGAAAQRAQSQARNRAAPPPPRLHQGSRRKCRNAPPERRRARVRPRGPTAAPPSPTHCSARRSDAPEIACDRDLARNAGGAAARFGGGAWQQKMAPDACPPTITTWNVQ